MTNTVIARASAARIMFGGVVCRPSAWRMIESTMMMRVKGVISRMMPGRKARPVMTRSVWTLSE